MKHIQMWIRLLLLIEAFLCGMIGGLGWWFARAGDAQTAFFLVLFALVIAVFMMNLLSLEASL